MRVKFHRVHKNQFYRQPVVAIGRNGLFCTP